MIPEEIKKIHIIKALEFIDKEGVPKGRQSTRYNLKHNDRLYPPKYVLSIASKFATGSELEANMFHGGYESNTFLSNLGFTIIQGNKLVSYKWPKIELCTIVLQNSNNKNHWLNFKYESRLQLLETIINNLDKSVDILILPAGFINEKTRKFKDIVDTVSKDIIDLLTRVDSITTVILGVDSLKRKEHMGIAINKCGVISIARKFYHPDGGLILSDGPYDKELGKSRIIEVNGKKFYLAVCWDTFGLNKLKVENTHKVDAVISLIHSFNKSGVGSSSTDFARKGLAGAAKNWKVKVFGSAIFSENRNTENWPCGVKWKHGDKSVGELTYNDIKMKGRRLTKTWQSFTIHFNYFKV